MSVNTVSPRSDALDVQQMNEYSSAVDRPVELPGTYATVRHVWDDCRAAHNPEVAGSNPAPATRRNALGDQSPGRFAYRWEHIWERRQEFGVAPLTPITMPSASGRARRLRRALKQSGPVARPRSVRRRQASDSRGPFRLGLSVYSASPSTVTGRTSRSIAPSTTTPQWCAKVSLDASAIRPEARALCGHVRE